MTTAVGRRDFAGVYAATRIFTTEGTQDTQARRTAEGYVNTDLGLLEWLGGMLDCPVIWDGEPETGGEQQLTVQDELIQGLLRIRTKTGKMHFKLNRSQSEYARRCTRRNIVLKARQVGITTYIAARFFVRTITRDDNAGRGWTIQNLHCSEVARWGRGGEEALASLRAAVVPGGEIVLEEKFKEGLSKVIDGTVECLNASSWSRTNKQ